MKQKVLFVDRDGVINKDSPAYIKSWSEFEFLPRSLGAIRRLTENGFDVVLITNQSAVNRNFISKNDLEAIHIRMKEVIKQNGGEVKDIFYCPHRPEDQCDCRKPLPGLILQAQEAYQIDVGKTMMVGDSAKDIECAKNAGCGGSILVQTGNGITAEKILAEKGIFPSFIVKDLYEAASLLINPDKKITHE
ncbi:MAG: D-glycero-beta-D-manno-heptose 1,7-bisphosphate 7-phosphatase [Deltaproteobacteria bacterium]|nr:D-glycero-beta-D-manno-heptose 1,7-bisphosphate 7-phosphatase [Deltaproteobacteria bacterium]MBW1984517.1 D-glycero-beta-D-manno-heptose 1,7-bisphosphate 7-phosphatase [Deltaproteobacteria bacterium]MBW2182060.1 D-glycero-beta-D-manno-heptose 1,7-bisphosphate 7-phosphatase [Deltaproteobacteria bacterium]MBW2364938.1 D-glycero-beta-D-manno-heptose 1,7-bisphosphate 7-phosphatase [Deltaproteobacteria bacterium]